MSRPTPKHTPPPWRYNEDVDQSEPLIRTEDGTVVLGFEVGGWGEESHWLVEDADGRLMAAAPDLRDATADAADRLDRIAALLNHDPSPKQIHEAYNLAYSGVQRAALARARGEPEGTTQ